MPLIYTPSPPPPQTTSPTMQSANSNDTPNTDGTRDDSKRTPLQIRDRRRRYLAMHPDYFSSPSLAGSEPLLHYQLIRRFQTAAEREAAARKTGLAAALASGVVAGETREARGATELDPVLDGDAAQTKAEGERMWRTRMERRFVEGQDEDFDYKLVDKDARYDDLEAEDRMREDEYFDAQEQEVVGGNGGGETGIQDF